MHGEVLHQLVRRGYSEFEVMRGESSEPIMVEASSFEMIPIALTVVFFALMLASVC